jgi:hypothetical protein
MKKVEKHEKSGKFLILKKVENFNTFNKMVLNVLSNLPSQAPKMIQKSFFFRCVIWQIGQTEINTLLTSSNKQPPFFEKQRFHVRA